MSAEEDPNAPRQRSPSIASLEDAKRAVVGPATGLFLVAVLGFFPMLAMAINPTSTMAYIERIATIRPPEELPTDDVPGTQEAEKRPDEAPRELPTPAMWKLILPMILYVFVFISAVQTYRLGNRRWAQFGAILALLPIHCACCIGIIAGTWSLIVLNRDDLKPYFAKP